MRHLRQGRALIGGLIFLSSAFGARSIAADDVNVQSATMMEWAADAALEPAAATRAQLENAIVALPKPAPATLRLTNTTSLRRIPATTTRAWPTPARFFTINEVLAKRKWAASGFRPVELAAVDQAGTASDAPLGSTPLIHGDEPFGLFTFRAPEGQLWRKWRKVEADIQNEAPALALCQVDPEYCTSSAARFVAIIKEVEKLHGRARLELVNRRINAVIRYISDVAQWAAPDIWSAPFDDRDTGALETGRGDCEDYAIAKYVALRQVGVPARNLRLLLVRDNAVRMAHAVLGVRENGHWLILDNRWNRLIEDLELKQFVPLFALGEHGVELFAAPYAWKQPHVPYRLTMKPSDELFSFGADSPASDQRPAVGGGMISLPLPM